jgi:hypothetical protein
LLSQCFTVLTHYQRLPLPKFEPQELEKNMEREKVRLTSIRTAAEAIVLKLGGSGETPNNNSGRVASSAAGIGILGQLNQLEKRWEDFVERIGTVRMEVCSSAFIHSGLRHFQSF